jgi:hypothetical protein
MPAAAIATRLPKSLEDYLREFWTSRGEAVSAGLRKSLEEWWVTQSFPTLEFRDGPAGRRAAVRGGPDVWEIVMIARALGSRRARLRAHFGDTISPEAMEQTLAYADRFPAEVEGRINENARIARMLGEPGTPRVHGLVPTGAREIRRHGGRRRTRPAR